jgi:hypothetical protein
MSRVKDTDMGLKAILAQLRHLDGEHMDVGVLSDTYPDGRTTAQVGAIQESRTHWMSRTSDAHEQAGGQVADAVHQGYNPRAQRQRDADSLAKALQRAAPDDTDRLRDSIGVKRG